MPFRDPRTLNYAGAQVCDNDGDAFMDTGVPPGLRTRCPQERIHWEMPNAPLPAEPLAPPQPRFRFLANPVPVLFAEPLRTPIQALPPPLPAGGYSERAVNNDAVRAWYQQQGVPHESGFELALVPSFASPMSSIPPPNEEKKGSGSCHAVFVAAFFFALFGILLFGILKLLQFAVKSKAQTTTFPLGNRMPRYASTDSIDLLAAFTSTEEDTVDSFSRTAALFTNATIVGSP
ncbi:uncharacterized protein LOC135387356 [Ornithodoros turicata]|uniref:uncharacterized protein LOC135387356 n=1 Tax=Ornithodoros turicata TaxID=34597 RepID=UPI003138C49E